MPSISPEVQFSIVYDLYRRAHSLTQNTRSETAGRGAASGSVALCTDQHSGLSQLVAHSPQHGTNSIDLTSVGQESALLTTLDKRELSKIVIRDAVYAQLLDLVPSRQHIRTTLYTLGPRTMQLDGMVRVPPTAETTYARSDSTISVREELTSRVVAMVCDEMFFATVLRPYLGAGGCRGHIISARVNGVEVL